MTTQILVGDEIITSIIIGSVGTGTGGTTDHDALSNLAYADSGHTGFAPALGIDDNYITDTEKLKLTNLTQVPDVTPTTISHAVTIDLSKPFQTSQAQLSGATVFSPITGTAVESFIHRKLLDLNGITPTFNGFTLWDSNAVADTVAGQINIVVFFKMGAVYYYNWFGSYTGTISDETAPTLSSISISDIAQIVAQINATSNEAATFYWGVYANGDTAPTYAQLVVGTGALSYGNTSLASTVSGNGSLTGLIYSTAYDVYYAATDVSGNHTEPVLVEFTTIAREQLVTPNPSGAQFDADNARFTWSNISGNAGYSYRSRINSGTWSGYTSLAANTTQLDIDATTGQTVGFELIAKGNNTTNVDSASSTEDSVTLTANQSPVASNVTITGNTTLGSVLTGSYTYSDNESNAEGTSTYRWLRDSIAIIGQTAITHTIVLADQGANLIFEVTPVASIGTSPGTAVQSAGLAIPANAAPSYSTVTLTGTMQEGQTISGTQSGYSDADSDAEGIPIIKYYKADTVGGAKTLVATAATYVLQTSDVGKYMYRGGTPVATTGTSPGEEVFSASAIVQPIVTESQMADWVVSNFSVINTNDLRTTEVNTACNACYLNPIGATNDNVIVKWTIKGDDFNSNVVSIKESSNGISGNLAYENTIFKYNNDVYIKINSGTSTILFSNYAQDVEARIVRTLLTEPEAYNYSYEYSTNGGANWTVFATQTFFEVRNIKYIRIWNYPESGQTGFNRNMRGLNI